MPTNQPNMTDTIDAKVDEPADAYTPSRPFEMRFVERKYPNGTFTEAEVYIGGIKMEGTANIFSDSCCHYYSPHDLASDLSALLEPGKGQISFCLDTHGPKLILGDNDDGRINVRIEERKGKAPYFKPTPPEVSIPKEEMVYELAKFLNNWLTHYAKKGGYEKEFTDYKVWALEVFNHDTIRQRFKQDGIEIYDFKGVPDPTAVYKVSVQTARLEESLRMLDTHLEAVVEKKIIKNDKGWVYILKSGKQLPVQVKEETEEIVPSGRIKIKGKKKVVRFEYPDTGSTEDEDLFNIIANQWNKVLATKSWADW